MLIDLAVLPLKLFDKGRLEHTLLATVKDESVLAAVPVVLLETQLVCLVKGAQVLVEKSALTVIDQHHNVVEVSHYEHDILP